MKKKVDVQMILNVFNLPKENVYRVKKEKYGFSVKNSKNKTYFISETYKGLRCDCPNAVFRKNKDCKHLQMVRGF